jgi:hypothetical protein
LTKLQELVLDYNEITSLPPEIGACLQLQTLSVGMSLLPISRILLLSCMKIKCNRLSGQLVEALGLVRELTSLDISQNNITTLPQSLLALGEVSFQLNDMMI